MTVTFGMPPPEELPLLPGLSVRVYVQFRSDTSFLEVPATAIVAANNVANGGALQGMNGRTLIQEAQGDDTVAEIAGRTIDVGGIVLNPIDLAQVSHDREDTPDLMIRHAGVEAFTLGIADIATDNIVDVGLRVDARLPELAPQIPLGVSLEPIYQQHLVVEEASNAFIRNLVMSVGIVVVVLALFMGWRAAIVVRVTLLLSVVCLALFGQVKPQFFPDSNTPLFFVHYKLPQGASIQQTSRDLSIFETWLSEQPEFIATTAFFSEEASRFILTYQAEDPNLGYGHIIVRNQTIETIGALITRMNEFAALAAPQGEFRAKRLAFGPGGGNPVEVRFSGSDPTVLRDLADDAIDRLMAASDNIVSPHINWREMEQVLRPIYANDHAQEAGITRDDVTATLRFAIEGIPAGVYHEGERQIPIVLRTNPDAGFALTDQLVYSDSARRQVPLTQLIDDFEFESQNTLVMRRDRLYTITTSVDVTVGLATAQVQSAVQETIDAMPLPTGYRMEWGGQYESLHDAQASLAGQLPMSGLILVLISILLFNTLRQPLIRLASGADVGGRRQSCDSGDGTAVHFHRVVGTTVTVGDADQERYGAG